MSGPETKNVHSCQNSLFLRNAMTFEVGVAETPHATRFFLRFFGR